MRHFFDEIQREQEREYSRLTEDWEQSFEEVSCSKKIVMFVQKCGLGFWEAR